MLIKKILSVLFCVVMIAALITGCKNTDTTPKAFSEMSAAEIIDRVYDVCEKTAFLNSLADYGNKLVTADIVPDSDTVYYSSSYYFGTNLSFASAAGSEPEIQPPAFSFCIAIMPDGTDMNEAAETVRNSADPQKWVCTGVSTVYVETFGNVLALIMADAETADSLRAGFLALSEANTDSTDSGTSDGSEIDTMIGIIDSIYTAAEGSYSAKDYFSTYRDEALNIDEITTGNCSMYFGTAIEFEKAVFSEYRMQPSAYSLCLLKTKDGVNTEAIMTQIRDNADPNKWICVSAEKTEVVENNGYIMLIMASNSEVELIKNAFISLELN